MHLHCQLIAETADSSLSILTHEGEFLCFILEDGYRAEKVMHKTRIPPGLYQIKPRRAGRFYEAYSKRYGCKFVPHIDNVPGFTWILMHMGNRITDTSGCQITGTAAERDRATGNFYIPAGKSEAAFLAVYHLLEQAFEEGETVTIRISREIVMTDN